MRKKALFLLLLAGLAFSFALVPVNALTLTLADRTLWRRAVCPGDTFQLRYLHSIALSDVWETFFIDADYRILLTETRFQGQGAGLPSDLAPGEELTREGPWFRISGMRRPVPSIRWRVQREWQNRFLFGQEAEANFSRQGAEGLIHIQVDKMSLGKWLRYILSKKLSSFFHSTD